MLHMSDDLRRRFGTRSSADTHIERKCIIIYYYHVEAQKRFGRDSNENLKDGRV